MKKKEFYHIKNLQSTKTFRGVFIMLVKFYHIKNLQSTKTRVGRGGFRI